MYTILQPEGTIFCRWFFGNEEVINFNNISREKIYNVFGDLEGECIPAYVLALRRNIF